MPRLVRALVFLFALVTGFVPARAAAPKPNVVILAPVNASPMEALAAREVRRYMYLRTGTLLPIETANRLPAGRDAILIARRGQPILRGFAEVAPTVRSLKAQQYVLRTLRRGGHAVLFVAGGDATGILYGAYRLTEKLGMRFYLHGDTVPDRRIALKVPVLNETGRPIFTLRGIQPFHDFPEGPDWWNTQEYLAIIGQLPKLRMNFFGLHTYPEGGVGPEPTVWIGWSPEARADGTVRHSYPAAYFNTVRGTWGYAPTLTSRYHLGASLLFDRDKYGPDVMRGYEPMPREDGECNTVFDRTGAMLRAAFNEAHALGVKTCVGTETPLTIPTPVKDEIRGLDLGWKDPDTVQGVYEGIFRRAAAAYPLDYYWLWTPEDWTWGGNDQGQLDATVRDIKDAYAALKTTRAPFRLATSGWVLGPQQDRAYLDRALPKDVPLSAINRQVGMSPVDPAFAQVKRADKWAIPWMEDDPGLTQLQLWAGRMRKDAVDAKDYGCSGLMGIHWRTRAIAPNVSALAHAGWDQSEFRKPSTPKEFVDGQTSAFPNNVITGTDTPVLYQTVRYNVSAYRLRVPNGHYKVTLQFVEPYYNAAGVRVFDVALEGRRVLDHLDVFARVGKDRALDYIYDADVKNGRLDITFTPEVEMPCIAAFAVEGAGYTRKINCGGPAVAGYEADLTPPSRDLPTDDFYRDWADAEFGPEIGPAAGRIFAAQDGKLPRPAGWQTGPGNLHPDSRPWSEAAKEYAFVDDLLRLRPQVRGAGNLARFDYWANTLELLRGMGRVECAWGAVNAAMEPVNAEKDLQAKARLARESVLPARRELIRAVTEAYHHLLATVSTTGEMGTIANWEQHILPDMLDKSGKDLTAALGEPLPADAELPSQYTGPLRIVVPAARTSVPPGEALTLRVLALSESAPKDAALYWRLMGKGAFRRIPLKHITRGVYTVALPRAAGDFEYYVRMVPAKSAPVAWPATAPALNQTVVLGPRA